jgi:hypothetical protein
MRALLITISLLFISCSNHKQAGIRDAERDFENGIMRIETYGLRMQKSPYDEYLKKHEIAVDGVAGCVVNEEILEHAEGYNSTMKSLIRKRLGKDVFTEAEAFAAANISKATP